MSKLAVRSARNSFVQLITEESPDRVQIINKLTKIKLLERIGIEDKQKNTTIYKLAREKNEQAKSRLRNTVETSHNNQEKLMSLHREHHT